MIDLAALQQSLNAAQSLTAAQASALLATAARMIQTAIDDASGGGAFGADLPGGTTRANVQATIWALQDSLLHAADGSTLVGQALADIKTACTRAAIELNAVAEGNATMARARDQLFADMADNLHALGGPIVVAAGIGAGVGVVLVAIVVLLAVRK